MNAPVPENEAARLATLAGLGILDTPPDLAFDELCALAAYICQTPVALISLVDEHRQWFKSRVGWSVEETPRDVAFCAHAILQPDLLVVPDARADQRFANNPLVTCPPSIRFYAGAPLVTTEGHALGTLCVIDHQPRELTAEQAGALRALSHQVVAQLRLHQQLAELLRINVERRQAEEELRKANDRLALAVRGSNVGIWENDMAGGDHRTGRLYCTNILEQLDYPAPESAIDFPTVVASIHPDDREPMEKVLRAYLAGETPEYSIEFRARHRDGSYRWMLSRGVAERDAAGRPLRFLGTRIDITERKRAEDALRQSEERFRGTFESAGVGIAHITLGGRWLRVNEKLCAIVGFTRAELLQRAFQDITYPEDLPASLERMGRLQRGQLRSYTLEKRYVCKDGSLVWVSVAVSLQRDVAGSPAYMIAIIQDISKRKRLEAELRRAKQTAEAASRAKSEFLAHVSHEVRTPLNAILGMNELALETPLSDRQRKYLTVMQSSAEGLLLVINDLLDFSKIEAGKIELDRAPFSVRAVVNDTLRSLALRAHRKGLELVGRIHPDAPGAVVGDAGRLRQVLTNLVGNAIKFTEEGEVVVEAEAQEQQRDWEKMGTGSDRPLESRPLENSEAFSARPVSVPIFSQTQSGAGQSERPEPDSLPCTLLFSVRDTGIGIPREKRQSIFEAFEQADRSMTRRYGGTGLGLSIASRLVGLMGGRITVKSEPGQGSTFRFTVRLRRPLLQPDHPITRAPAELHGLPILLVDDHAASRRTLLEWLHGWRTEPTVVNDGGAALEALRQAAAAGRPLALLVLNARLKGIDALALATQVRQAPDLAGVAIILLTVEDQARELGRYHERGIAACVMKPVQEEEFLDAVCRARALPSSFAPSAAAAGPEDRASAESDQASTETASVRISGRRFHVLVAEDNPYNQAVLEDLLPRWGHTLHLAADGRAALAALEQSPFDVMLLDIHLPELDGFQVVAIQRQREQGTGRHLPIIALTARSASGERERCLQAGMDDYLAKPVRAAELFTAIDRVVSGEAVPRPELAEAGVPTDLLDPAALLAACDGNADLLRKMCSHFQTLAPARLSEAGEALRDGDRPRLREAAHKLGGMVSSFSAIAADAAALLGRLAADEKIEEANRAHRQLSEVVGRLISELDSLSVEQLRGLRDDSY
jgi:PAS domain S-box-containing protein